VVSDQPAPTGQSSKSKQTHNETRFILRAHACIGVADASYLLWIRRSNDTTPELGGARLRAPFLRETAAFSVSTQKRSPFVGLLALMSRRQRKHRAGWGRHIGFRAEVQG
jgi:hypothetical protein